MLVERGLQVMNVEVVGDAYSIAANYLRKAGAIPDNLATNEQLMLKSPTVIEKPSPTPQRPTSGLSKSSSNCSSTASSTGSGSPTRRLPGLKRK